MLGYRLLSFAQSTESKVLYLSHKGDVYRYNLDVAGDEGAAAKAEALQTYSEAEALAKKELTWLSPARLILTYNFSRFHSEYRNSLEWAVKIAIRERRKALRTEFVKMYSYEELGEKLRKLRLEKDSGSGE